MPRLKVHHQCKSGGPRRQRVDQLCEGPVRSPLHRIQQGARLAFLPEALTGQTLQRSGVDVWCVSNGAVNVVLVGMSVTCLEPLRMLPWERPRLWADQKVLEERGHMPDWFRFASKASHQDEAGAVTFISNGSRRHSDLDDGADERVMRSLKRGFSWLGEHNTQRRMYRCVTSLSFFDDVLGATEDGAQLSLQVLFLVSCHPSESAAVATLLSIVFSVLRGALKLTSALSNDIIMESFAAFSCCSLPSSNAVLPRTTSSNKWATSPSTTTFEGNNGSFTHQMPQREKSGNGDDDANQDIASTIAPTTVPAEQTSSDSSIISPPKTSAKSSKDDAMTGHRESVLFLIPSSIPRRELPPLKEEESGDDAEGQ